MYQHIALRWSGLVDLITYIVSKENLFRIIVGNIFQLVPPIPLLLDRLLEMPSKYRLLIFRWFRG